MLHIHKTKDFICIAGGGGGGGVGGEGAGGGGSSTTYNLMFYVIGRRLNDCQF